MAGTELTAAGLPRHVRVRARFACGVLLAALAALLVRLFQIQVLHHEGHAKQARDQVSRLSQDEAVRADLRDVNGVVLATSIRPREAPALLWIDWHFLRKNPRGDYSLRTLLELASILDLPSERVEALIAHANEREARPPYCQALTIESRVPPRAAPLLAAYHDVYGRIRGAAWRRAVKLEHRRVRMHTFSDPRDEGGEYYELLGEILGRVAENGVGVHGAEGAFDLLLRGRAGALEVQTGPQGLLRHVVHDGRGVGAVVPHHVYLTVDVRLQKILVEALREGFLRCAPLRTAGLILDPHTGRILASATWPWNRAMQSQSEPIFGLYEPGSVFKCFVAAQAIAEGRVEPEGGPVLWRGGQSRSIPRRRRPVTDTPAVSNATFADGFIQSSNIVMSIAAERLGPAGMKAMLRRFKLTEPVVAGRQLWPGDARDTYRTWKEAARISPQDVISMAWGSAVHVSMAAIARAYAALVNGGYLVEPHIHYGLQPADGGRLHVMQAPPPQKVIEDARVCEAMVTLLRRAVEDRRGTGWRLAQEVNGLSFGGKTGTSKRYMPRHGGYSHTRFYTGSFICHAPADRPRYVIMIKMEIDRHISSNGMYYGSGTAGPVAVSILSTLFREDMH